MYLDQQKTSNADHKHSFLVDKTSLQQINQSNSVVKSNHSSKKSNILQRDLNLLDNEGNGPKSLLEGEILSEDEGNKKEVVESYLSINTSQLYLQEEEYKNEEPPAKKAANAGNLNFQEELLQNNNQQQMQCSINQNNKFQNRNLPNGAINEYQIQEWHLDNLRQFTFQEIKNKQQNENQPGVGELTIEDSPFKNKQQHPIHQNSSRYNTQEFEDTFNNSDIQLRGANLYMHQQQKHWKEGSLSHKEQALQLIQNIQEQANEQYKIISSNQFNYRGRSIINTAQKDMMFQMDELDVEGGVAGAVDRPQTADSKVAIVDQNQKRKELFEQNQALPLKNSKWLVEGTQKNVGFDQYDDNSNQQKLNAESPALPKIPDGHLGSIENVNEKTVEQQHRQEMFKTNSQNFKKSSKRKSSARKTCSYKSVISQEFSPQKRLDFLNNQQIQSIKRGLTRISSEQRQKRDISPYFDKTNIESFVVSQFSVNINESSGKQLQVPNISSRATKEPYQQLIRLGSKNTQEIQYFEKIRNKDSMSPDLKIDESNKNIILTSQKSQRNSMSNSIKKNNKGKQYIKNESIDMQLEVNLQQIDFNLTQEQDGQLKRRRDLQQMIPVALPSPPNKIQRDQDLANQSKSQQPPYRSQLDSRHPFGKTIQVNLFPASNQMQFMNSSNVNIRRIINAEQQEDYLDIQLKNHVFTVKSSKSASMPASRVTVSQSAGTSGFIKTQSQLGARAIEKDILKKSANYRVGKAIVENSGISQGSQERPKPRADFSDEGGRTK